LVFCWAKIGQTVVVTAMAEKVRQYKIHTTDRQPTTLENRGAYGQGWFSARLKGISALPVQK